MLGNNKYTVVNSSSSIGSPVGECLVEVDIAIIGTTQIVSIIDPFTLGARTVSCHVVAEGIVGSLTGAVALVQSNDGLNWHTLGTQVALDAVDHSSITTAANFGGKYIGARITKGAMTAGAIRLYFIAKHA